MNNIELIEIPTEFNHEDFKDIPRGNEAPIRCPLCDSPRYTPVGSYGISMGWLSFHKCSKCATIYAIFH